MITTLLQFIDKYSSSVKKMPYFCRATKVGIIFIAKESHDKETTFIRNLLIAFYGNIRARRAADGSHSTGVEV